MGHIENLQNLMPNLKQAEILDLGCGRGGLLIEFLQKGYKAVGLDKNLQYLKATEDLARQKGLSVKLHQGQAEHLPFTDQSFDPQSHVVWQFRGAKRSREDHL